MRKEEQPAKPSLVADVRGPVRLFSLYEGILLNFDVLPLIRLIFFDLTDQKYTILFSSEIVSCLYNNTRILSAILAPIINF